MNRCINILAFGWPKGGESRKERPLDPVLGFGRKGLKQKVEKGEPTWQHTLLTA